MSKFGSMNNFQLTRETHELQKRLQQAEDNLSSIEIKTKEIAECVFENNEINIKQFIKTINKTVDVISLKKRIDLIEKKLKNKKMYPIQISNEEKEQLQTFLNEYKLNNFYSCFIELGVRTIEDILYLTEEDLLL